MHFAFLAPPLTGHYKPLAALAQELERRGHRATFVHQSGAAPLADRFGVAFAPVAGTANEHLGIAGTVREMARQTDMLCERAPSVLRAIGADAIVADQLEPAGGLIAAYLRLPYASVACALPVNREPGVPPPYVGWRYDPSPRGRWWNEGGWKIADRLMRPLREVIQRRASSWGLGRWTRLEDCFSSRLQIAQALPGIDFPRRDLPNAFHYVGPLRGSAGEVFEMPEARPGPLVYCSLGTLQGGRAKLFAAVAAACEDLRLPLLISHGGRLSSDEVARLRGKPMVYAHVPQEAVLAEASLVVTHGGFNTVLEALACGLPMVAIPLAFDQPAVGARIRYRGVGETVHPLIASRRRLRNAIGRVLGTTAYRERAEALGAEIASAGGVKRGADLVEAAMR